MEIFFLIFFSLDYLTAIDTPMDLRTVKEELLGGNYKTATDFVKDMRLIFTNSRNYNTNKRSRVSRMSFSLASKNVLFMLMSVLLKDKSLVQL